MEQAFDALFIDRREGPGLFSEREREGSWRCGGGCSVLYVEVQPHVTVPGGDPPKARIDNERPFLP